MDIDEEELELCAWGGVVFSPLTAGGSTFIGLCESSEIPPFPFTTAAGAAEALLVEPSVCSVDLGEGVAVDMAEIGEEAAELCACGVEGVIAAGWMLLTLILGSCVEEFVEFSDSLPSTNREDSLGLSALRLPADSPPLSTLSDASWM